MASNLTRKWRALLQVQTKTPAAEGSTEGESRRFVPRMIDSIMSIDTKAKKRKLEETASSSKVTSVKKLAVASSTAKPAPSVKKESKAAVKELTTAKSDSSFFSAPKPKRPLPSFKKAPAAVKKEVDPNVAQPSSYDPFLEIVKSMKQPRKDSPSTATPPPTLPVPTASSTTSRQVSAEGTSSDKKKKSVTWAPDGQLELVKLIERAVYDDDPADVSSIPFVIFTYCMLTLDTRNFAPVGTHRVYTPHTASAILTEAKERH